MSTSPIRKFEGVKFNPSHKVKGMRDAKNRGLLRKKIKKERLSSILKADADFYYSVIEHAAETRLRPL